MLIRVMTAVYFARDGLLARILSGQFIILSLFESLFPGVISDWASLRFVFYPAVLFIYCRT